MNPWPILAAVLLIGLAGFQGYRMGSRAADARHERALLQAQNEMIQAAEQASRKEAERLAMQSERDALARDLEDQANAEPDDGSCGLPAGRVQRLNLR
jgi:hypothetical protein